MTSNKSNSKSAPSSAKRISRYSKTSPQALAWKRLNDAQKSTLLKSAGPRRDGWFDDILDKALSIAEDYGGNFDARIPAWAGTARKFRDKYIPQPRSSPARAEAKEIKKIEKKEQAISYAARAMPHRVRPVRSRTTGGVGNTSASELIFTVKSGATVVPAGTILANIPLNPTAMGLPKLARAVRAVEKYRFNKIKITYDPQVGMGFNGGIIFYFEYDPEDIMSSAVGAQTTIAAAMAHLGAVNTPVHTSTSLHFRPKFEMPELFVDGGTQDARLTTAGRLVIVAASELQINQTFGLVACDWQITTEVPTEDLDLPSGDFWGGTGSSTSGLTTSDKFGTWVENKSSTFRPESFSPYTGVIGFGPGSYIITTRVSSGTSGMSFSGADIVVASPGVASGWPYWEDPLHSGSLTTPVGKTTSLWVFGDQPFKVTVCCSPTSNWLNTNIFVNAVTSTPLSLNQRTSMQKLRALRVARAEEAALDTAGLIPGIVSPSPATCHECKAASFTHSSSASSSSAGSGSVPSLSDYVVVRRNQT